MTNDVRTCPQACRPKPDYIWLIYVKGTNISVFGEVLSYLLSNRFLFKKLIIKIISKGSHFVIK
jgi:hypothetical protein